jgi:DNA polymerase (family 10)
MRNPEIAEILREIAIMLDMDDVPFKPRAYEKAARSIEALEEDVEEIYRKGGMKALIEIPGVGQSIAEKIEEVIKTGKLRYLEELKKKVPVDLKDLSQIEGLGPKTIKAIATMIINSGNPILNINPPLRLLYHKFSCHFNGGTLPFE